MRPSACSVAGAPARACAWRRRAPPWRPCCRRGACAPILAGSCARSGLCDGAMYSATQALLAQPLAGAQPQATRTSGRLASYNNVKALPVLHVCLGCAASTRVRLLQEYVASADQAEAERCLRELAVPFFHHELVKQALLAAMEAPAAQGPLLALLSRMADSGLVSGSQMQKARLPQHAPCCMPSVAGGAKRAQRTHPAGPFIGAIRCFDAP